MALNATHLKGELFISRSKSTQVSHSGKPHRVIITSQPFVQIEECDSCYFATGSNISYTIQHEGRLVANSSAESGTKPHNITLSDHVVDMLGPGCHNLTLAASNAVTAPSVSSSLELCVLEPVQGLQAAVMAEEDECPDSDLIIGVSLEQGGPVELLFTLTGAKDTLSESRDMLNGSLQAYTFSNPLEGTYSFS